VSTARWWQPDWKSGTHQDRLEQLRRHVAGKSVLDMGAGSGLKRPDWMHSLVASIASEAVGIELDPRLAERARARGYDVRTGNAESMDLGRTFDVVLAGEIIEHLSCPGAFLDAARRHLTAGGRLVLTTPNAFAVVNFVYRLAGQPRVNKQHVCWYDEVTLRQLLQRHDFRVVEVAYLRHRTPGRVRSLLARAVRSVLPPRLAENTLCVVAAPA
jgi:2-polyprenyl-3-methyl-5-hydroxy-6-metoxy-1,4-benzoquinol methylase